MDSFSEATANAEIETVIERFEAGFRDNTKPQIEDFLPDASDTSRRPLLRELVATELELRLKQGQPARLEEYLNRFPELNHHEADLATLIRIEFFLRSRREPLRLAEYQRRFPELYRCLHADTDEYDDAISQLDVHSGAADFTRQLLPRFSDDQSRYTLTEVHAEGGLGRIWIARDHELERDVAIKEMKQEYAADTRHQQRFLQEAFVTGCLEHPGIVPIHSVGSFQDGRVYYAMRLVRGTVLRKAIRSYHASAETPGKWQGFEFRRLLSRMVDVANTIDYAHSQRIIHRDIKPDNIMIGSFGETQVVDWGLAKRLEEAAEPQEPAGDAMSDTKPSISVQTTVGEVMGSLGYMSPEQRSGEIDKLGPESDVYSLGATLFTLMTNKTPTPDRAKDKTFKGPLASICKKALASRPEHRYATAKLFAEDLERLLADEPTSAHKETLSERASRSLRRHRKVVFPVLVLSSILAIVSTVAAFKLDSYARSESAAKGLAESHQQKSEQFIGGIHGLYRQLGADLEMAVEARQRVVDTGLQYAGYAKDEFVRAMWLSAVSQGLSGMGDYQATIKHLLEAEEIFVDHPDVTDHYLITIWYQLAEANKRQGREVNDEVVKRQYLQTAREFAWQAIEVGKRSLPDTAEELLGAYNELTSIERTASNYDQAIAAAEKGAELATEIFGPASVGLTTALNQKLSTLIAANRTVDVENLMVNIRDQLKLVGNDDLGDETHGVAADFEMLQARWTKKQGVRAGPQPD